MNPYEFERTPGKISKTALGIVRYIRGTKRRPTIVVGAVLPRCGSVYTSQVLALHPDLLGYPNGISKLSFLRETGTLVAHPKRFFRNNNSNANKIGDMDFLPLFGAALVWHLHSFVSKEKTMLLKDLYVRFLTYFALVFRCENLLLLIRDGRDRVHSFVKHLP